MQNSHAFQQGNLIIKSMSVVKVPSSRAIISSPWFSNTWLKSANLTEGELREFELTEMMSSNYSKTTQMKKSCFTASAWTGTITVCQATGITVIYSA